MTFFIDANIVLYSATPSEYQEPCQELLDAIRTGAAGRTSTAVLQEVWHLESSGRVAGVSGLTESAYALLSPLLPVTDEIFRRALALDFERAGSNDRVHAATCLANGVEVIVSADSHFDAAPGLRRVDPLSSKNVEGLLSD